MKHYSDLPYTLNECNRNTIPGLGQTQNIGDLNLLSCDLLSSPNRFNTIH